MSCGRQFFLPSIDSEDPVQAVSLVTKHHHPRAITVDLLFLSPFWNCIRQGYLLGICLLYPCCSVLCLDWSFAQLTWTELLVG